MKKNAFNAPPTSQPFAETFQHLMDRGWASDIALKIVDETDEGLLDELFLSVRDLAKNKDPKVPLLLEAALPFANDPRTDELFVRIVRLFDVAAQESDDLAPFALPVVRKALAHEDSKVRMEGMDLLGTIRGARTVPDGTILSFLDQTSLDPDNQIREYTQHELRLFLSAPQIPAPRLCKIAENGLLPPLNDRNLFIRSCLCSALKTIKDCVGIDGSLATPSLREKTQAVLDNCTAKCVVEHARKTLEEIDVALKKPFSPVSRPHPPLTLRAVQNG